MIFTNIVGIKSYFILRDKITWVNLKNMLSERYKTQKTEYYDSICMKLQKFQNYSDKKQISGGLRTREGITCKKGMKKLLGVVEMLYILVVVDVT